MHPGRWQPYPGAESGLQVQDLLTIGQQLLGQQMATPSAPPIAQVHRRDGQPDRRVQGRGERGPAAGWHRNDHRRRGADGTALAAILTAHPHMHSVLFDLPHVITHAPAVLAGHGVGDRAECAAGDQQAIQAARSAAGRHRSLPRCTRDQILCLAGGRRTAPARRCQAAARRLSGPCGGWGRLNQPSRPSCRDHMHLPCRGHDASPQPSGSGSSVRQAADSPAG